MNLYADLDKGITDECVRDPCASSNHIPLTADKDKCLLWSSTEEPIQ